MKFSLLEKAAEKINAGEDPREALLALPNHLLTPIDCQAYADYECGIEDLLDDPAAVIQCLLAADKAELGPVA